MATLEKTPCPRCGQDWVTEARVKQLNKIVYVCPECEALWTDIPAISAPNVKIHGEGFIQYTEFMDAHGLGDRWAYLEILSEWCTRR
ncbi:MAG TPA: hypothetical protein VGM37_00435 [Armatimonadota bacterium]|jgi:transcription elongation factor Elf1